MARRDRIACSFAWTLAACGVAESQPRTGDAMIEPYLAIATALAEDRNDGLAALAATVKRTSGELTGKPGIADIAGAADGVGATDITAARRSFKTMSDGMVEYMRSEPTTHAGRVIVHCPMAFSDKGALWVQSDGKIANPYYGAKMLRCGNKVDWSAQRLPSTAVIE